MIILNKRGPRIDPCGTPSSILHYFLNIFPLKSFRYLSYAFSLASNKSWLSVSEALDRFTNIVSSFLHLSRVLMVIITRLECDLVYPVIFLFYILHARAIESAEFREFQLPTIFQIQWKNLLWMHSLLRLRLLWF